MCSWESRKGSRISIRDRIQCSTCGANIIRPEGFARRKIRCASCGYYVDTPLDWWENTQSELETDIQPPATSLQNNQPASPVRAKRRADPRDTRPDFTPDEPGGEPILIGTQDEDDDLPYTVPGTGLKRCPVCREELPLSAVFCVHCGRDLTSRERAKRVSQPMDGEWEEWLPLDKRLMIFAALQPINLLTSIAVYFTVDGPLGMSDYITQLGGQTVHIFLQTFLLGSYDAYRVKRNHKGVANLTRRTRVAFYPLSTKKIAWRESTHVGIIAAHHVGIFSWILCVYLLLMLILPGVLFYLLVIRPETHDIALGDEYGGANEVLFRTHSHELASEVARFTAEATGLTYRQVM